MVPHANTLEEEVTATMAAAEGGLDAPAGAASPSGYVLMEEDVGGDLNFNREGRPFDTDCSDIGYAGDVTVIATGQASTR